MNTSEMREYAKRTDREHVLDRLLQKEFEKRCKAVKICLKCGHDLKIEEKHPTLGEIARCKNTSCSNFNEAVIL